MRNENLKKEIRQTRKLLSKLEMESWYYQQTGEITAMIDAVDNELWNKMYNTSRPERS